MRKFQKRFNVFEGYFINRFVESGKIIILPQKRYVLDRVNRNVFEIDNCLHLRLQDKDNVIKELLAQSSVILVEHSPSPPTL